MKRFIDLIPRYLIKNKKRTLFTAVGIMLAAVLIVCLSITITSYKRMQMEKAFQRSGGSYHGTRGGADLSYLIDTKSDNSIKEVGNSISLGLSPVDKTNIKIDISAYDDAGKRMQKFILKEGNYPTKLNEIAIEKWALDKIKKDYKIGDKIKLQYINNFSSGGTDNFTKGENEFVLSGVLEDRGKSKFQEIASGCITINTLEKLSLKQFCKYTQYIVLKDTPTVDAISKIALNTKTTISPNTDLVDFYKSAKNTNRVMIFLDIIIAMAAIAVIYNMFNISVIERLHEFGLLRVIGAEPKHIKIIIFGESIILGIISVTLGVFMGIYGYRAVFILFDKSNVLYSTTTVPFAGIIQAYIICFIAILISVYYPSKYASELSPVECLNITGNVTLKNEANDEQKAIKISKRMNFTTSMAIVNMKRNKKRFWATVISITISIMLFITAASIVKFIDPLSIAAKQVDSDYILTFKTMFKQEGYSNSTIDEISKIKGIEELYANKYIHASIVPPTNRVSEEYKDFMKKNATPNSKEQYDVAQGKYWLGCEVFSLTEDRIKKLKKYLEEGSIDIEAMKKDSVILIQNLNNSNEAKIKIGDEVELTNSFLDSNGKWQHNQGKVKIAAILNQLPLSRIDVGIKTVLISHEDLMKNRFNIDNYQVIRINTKNNDKDLTVKKQLESYINEISNAKLISYEEEFQSVREIQRNVSILLYSFIFVTLLIGIINIINTMSMNVILRKREFGMLRAIGMDNTGVRAMILKEGLLYGLISAILGCIFGFALFLIVYWFFRKDPMSYWFLSNGAMIGGFIGSIVIAILASIGPLRRLLSDSVIDSIRTVE